MNFPPIALVTLLKILKRDGILVFIKKLFTYALSKDAYLWLLRGGNFKILPPIGSKKIPPSLFLARVFAKSHLGFVLGSYRKLFLQDKDIIKFSKWFDEKWYVRENSSACNKDLPAIFHYIKYGKIPKYQPCVDFVGDEYLTVNPDVGYAKVHPLIHFERYGIREGRLISFLENDKKSTFPKDAISGRRDFSINPPVHRRLAIFAAFSSTGKIPKTTLIYLNGLRKVSDNIIFVTNNPLFIKEINKLKNLVATALFSCHGEYDFGSYKRGWIIAKERNLLSSDIVDEVILANDSCYGPVYSFNETFETMSTKKCDFWGLSSCPVLGRDHIQSFFFVFRRPVIDSEELNSFLLSITKQPTRGHIVMRYEFKLTTCLEDAGYSFDVLVPRDFREKYGFVPSRMPVTIMSKYHFPLIKVKSINGDCDESISKSLKIVRSANPELAAVIKRGTLKRNRKRFKISDYRNSQTKTKERIADKVYKGGCINVVFFVSYSSIFSFRPLFDAMLNDEIFNPKIFIIPEFQNSDDEFQDVRSKCKTELELYYPKKYFLEGNPDEFGLWPDIIESFDADIVCYPSPYDLSSFRYNPHYAVGRSFLPIHVNYGFYNSCYDRSLMGRQNYAYFWKAFFECDATAAEYKKYSILKGANADVVGYIKMDALATAKPLPRKANRKRVLIAPHHSVDGGANDTLALSNFQRYADYFLKLPEKFPNIDFVFRPHPFLFTILSNASKWGQAKVDTWIETMKSYPNVIWSDKGDYFPVFASCDGAIQDCGSYLVEWFYTGKPCCYMLKSPSDIESKFAPLGKECLSHCYIAYDELAIEEFLNGVIVNECDSKAVSRLEFSKTIMVNYPNAAKVALDSIRKSLGLKDK